MSTDPTSTPPAAPGEPTPTPPFQSGGAAADFAVSNRSTIAYILIVIGLAFLGGSIYCFSKAYNADEAIKKDADKDKEKDAEKDKKEDPTDKDKDKKAKFDNPHLTEYVMAAIIGLMGAVAGLGVAAHTLAATPKLTYAESLTDARVTLLLAGGLLGLVLMFGGLLFATYWFSSLTKALEGGKLSELRWVIGPLAVLLFGAGIAFLSAQPARAEERNNAMLRKMIYGTNLALTTLLLVVLLLVGNVFAAIKIPNKLDTTESGLYSLELNDVTKEYLAGLSKTVTVYAIMPEGEDPILSDTMRLLDACAAANPSKFKVRKLSPTLSRDEINQLRNKYPLADQSRYGLLVTLADDDKQAAFIRLDEMVKQDFDQATRRNKTTFEGEARIARELLALNETKNKAVAYFTVGHGELDVIAPPPQQGRKGARRPATRLRAAIEKSDVEIRPLEFDLAAPKVPDDATIVVVADPRAPFTKEEAAALQAYMTTPRTGGAKGKLVLLSSPYPKADGSGVEDIGLTGVAQAIGVEFGQKYIYNQQQGQFGYTDLQAVVNEDLIESRNPIALSFRPPRGVIFGKCREVLPGGPPGGPLTVDWLFASYPPSRITWTESSPPANPAKVLEEFRSDAAVVQAKEASNRTSRVVGVIVSEGTTGRAVVFGSGEAFGDPDGRSGQNALQSAENNAELFAVCVNWLRDRPPVANIVGKTYGQYNPPKTVDDVRIFWLPVGVSLLGVVALGAGVWVSRRK